LIQSIGGQLLLSFLSYLLLKRCEKNILSEHLNVVIYNYFCQYQCYVSINIVMY
jgi:hypothetical protein